MRIRATDLLTSVQLAIILGIVEAYVLVGITHEAEAFRDALVLTVATLTVARAVEERPHKGVTWTQIRGTYFLLFLLVAAFGVVVFAAAKGPIDEAVYYWDFLALAGQIFFSNAVVGYVRGMA